MFKLVILTTILFTVLRKLLAVYKKYLKNDKKAAFIVVLGDIGRSPRMNYHSLSLAKLGYQVSIIGYNESKQMDEIQSNPNIQIVPLSIFPKKLQVGPKIFQYGLKAMFLSIGLLVTLLKMKISPKFVLVQNPPSVPTLAIVYFFSKIVNTKFLIDWHNYGFTILSLNKGKDDILVKICKKFEIFFGQKSDLNFCVTEAMKTNLLNDFRIKAITMHDKAHERFKQLNIQEKQNFYTKLTDQYKISDLNDNEGISLLVKSIENKKTYNEIE